MEFLKRLFGIKPATQPTPPQPANVTAPEPVASLSPRVMVIIYDPVMDAESGKRLSQYMNWGRHEDYTNQFINDMLECSGGLIRYQIVRREMVEEFPLKADGFRYNTVSYVDVLRRASAPHEPDTLDYQEFLRRHKIVEKVAANEIDEVWVFGFPYAGFYESTMGGKGAFFCNSEPLANTAHCPRRFVVMGFSLERGIGEMLEAMGHRAEFTMEKVYARTSTQNNLWRKFIRYDKSHAGQAECGNIHFAPNSDKDYDWGNTRLVNSYCNSWYNYPSAARTPRQVNCTEWGNGDIREHHKWWFKHLPKAGGRTNGIANNWWQYIADPNRVSV